MQEVAWFVLLKEVRARGEQGPIIRQELGADGVARPCPMPPACLRDHASRRLHGHPQHLHLAGRGESHVFITHLDLLHLRHAARC